MRLLDRRDFGAEEYVDSMELGKSSSSFELHEPIVTLSLSQ